MLVPCQVCGPACSKICEGVSRCLCPADRPSPIFVVFSVLTNVTLLVFAIIGIAATGNSEWQGVAYAKVNTGLGVFAGIAVFNTIFACYLYWRFSRMTSPEADTSPHAAAVKLCMYDIGVFVYLVFAVFIIVWTLLEFSCDPKGIDSCEKKINMLDYCRYTTWFYLVAGVFVCAFSICTECCKPPRYVTVASSQAGAYPQHQAQYVAQPRTASVPPAVPPPAPVQYGGQPQPQPTYAAPPPQPYGVQPQHDAEVGSGEPSMAQKAGNVVGGIIGKGFGALKK
eukprot:Rhum_TRINITY_DN23381_c0_g1::Rhum_TRINITY_DN23381_c0_g1_i1::g.177850::m.177850